MADNGWLPQAYLEQCPACSWIVDAEGVFRAVYGDPAPIFGKPATELIERSATAALESGLAENWTRRFARVFAGETLMLHERCGNATWYITVFPIRRDQQFRFAGGFGREVTPWATAEQELRHTALGAMKALENDRKMASRFLHDSVGQNLTALGLQLDLIRMDLETVSPETCARIVEIQKMLEGMMSEVREYSYELNPSIAERAGLRAALDRLVTRTRANFDGAISLRADPSVKIDPKIASPLYHIAQESVANAIQHAACSDIEIALKSSRSGPVLEVRDNGRGFDPGDVLGTRRGLGLLTMEHYAAQAGLVLAITSNRDTGTLVRAQSQET
ncbi:MAG TPA: histidine kinase [Bryobacteraceae bacterium]|nr:histidine kinase [Bryobacteraceae bacterium]